MNIAIDGPAGAGKSTVAKRVANRLGYLYIDTGAMYRALAWAALHYGVDPLDEDSVSRLLRESDLSLERQNDGQIVKWNGQEITSYIRTPEVSHFASVVASYGDVRAQMLKKQREMADGQNVVMDGRDIGTHVLPDADVKIFLTASVEERAKRRAAELSSKGHAVDYEALEREIAERDKRDSERIVAPLRQADDAILVDTTGKGIDEVVDAIVEICEQKGKRV
jgi:cytidylate kinase